MTKNTDFQTELKSKIKEGIKPSHLKKSRSANDLATVKNDQELAQLKKQITSCQEQLTSKEQELNQANSLITELTEQLDKSLAIRLELLKKPDLTVKYQLCQEQNTQLQKNLDLANQRISNLQKQVNSSPSNVLDKQINRLLWAMAILTLLTSLAQWLTKQHD